MPVSLEQPVPLPPAAGRLLVAAASMQDPNFRRTVVYLIDHDQHGSLGVVLNRPSQVAVDTVLREWSQLDPEPPVLFVGGPVATDSALGISQVVTAVGDDEPPGWRRIVGDIGITDLDTPVPVLAGSLAALRIFAGYAGWSPGQLEDEIEQGAWEVVPAEPADLFNVDPPHLWARVLRRQGGTLALKSTQPADPEFN